MSDFEERARRAAEAMRQEAARHADTDSALADVLAGRSTVEPVAIDGWSRRRAYGVTAFAIGTAAALIGLAAVVTVGDDQAIVGDPPSQPTPPTSLPAASTVPGTALSPGNTSRPTGSSTSPDTVANTATTQVGTSAVPTSAVAPGLPTLPPISTTTTSPPDTVPASPPSTTMPTTTSPRTTIPSMTMPGQTPPTSTSPSDPSPEPSWVPTQPAPPDPPSGEDVPYVIALQVADRDTRYRTEEEWELDIEPGVYVQTFSNDDGSHRLYVQTSVPRPDVIVEPIPGKIGPWELFDGSGEYEGLTLATDDLAVFLDSNWLGYDDLRALAAELGPRGDGGPGWELGELPGDVELVGEGYWWSGDARSDLVSNPGGRPVSQVDVSIGTVGMDFAVPRYLTAGPSTIVDFDGEQALFTGPTNFSPDEQFVSLQWEFQPGVYVRFRTTGDWSDRELVDHARNVIVAESRAFWEQQPVLPGDACRTFDC